jgi:hypothetical protein
MQAQISGCARKRQAVSLVRQIPPLVLGQILRRIVGVKWDATGVATQAMGML